MTDLLADLAISPHLKEAPFASADDAAALFASYMREADNAAIGELSGALFEVFTRRSSDLAAFIAGANPMYAIGGALDLAGEAIGLPRAVGETDETYRARLFTIDEVITPRALLDAVYAITSRLSATRPEYLERPDDEPFLLDDAGDVADANGWYLFDAADTGVEPISNGGRRDEARGSKPRHALIFDSYYRTEAPAGWSETLFETRDRPVSFNGWGSPILVLPPFRAPGSADAADMFLSDTPTISSTADLEAADLLLADLAGEDDVAIDWQYGAHVFDVETDEATVVSTVAALLAARVAFPVQPMILLDPELPL